MAGAVSSITDIYYIFFACCVYEDEFFGASGSRIKPVFIIAKDLKLKLRRLCKDSLQGVVFNGLSPGFNEKGLFFYNQLKNAIFV